MADYLPAIQDGHWLERPVRDELRRGGKRSRRVSPLVDEAEEMAAPAQMLRAADIRSLAERLFAISEVNQPSPQVGISVPSKKAG
jgi:hypothetical protein